MPSPFPHPWWAWDTIGNPPPKCVDEWLIIDVSNAVRAKPHWKTKYKDAAIAAKWRQEISQLFDVAKVRFLDALLDYMFHELQWYEQQERLLGDKYHIGCFDGILFGDGVVLLDIKTRLQCDAARLVLSIREVDYHPHSNNQVVDLVHPSLYPGRYGVSPIVVDGAVSVLQYCSSIASVKQNVHFGVSEQFQWLPAVMENQNGRLKFASYINNLHRLDHASLYTTIEDVINAVVPGLNFCLSRSASQFYQRITIPDWDEVYNEEYHEKERQTCEPTLDIDAYEHLLTLKQHYVVDYSPKYTDGPVTDRPIDVLSFDNVKVIVKMANIELTPENPSYPGGSWHVEGTINEDIVATVLYYYDVENITTSRLSFKYAFDDPNYDQGDTFYCKEIFGLRDGQQMMRTVGGVDTSDGRVVIFPNTLQHHVDAFELADKSRNGHRKILCFFIVDPYNEHVVTTAEVPPQQPEWWHDQALMDVLLPQPVQNQILQLLTGWRLSLAEAKTQRETLMAERGPPPPPPHEDDPDDYPYRRTFSLCEH